MENSICDYPEEISAPEYEQKYKDDYIAYTNRLPDSLVLPGYLFDVRTFDGKHQTAGTMLYVIEDDGKISVSIDKEPTLASCDAFECYVCFLLDVLKNRSTITVPLSWDAWERHDEFEAVIKRVADDRGLAYKIYDRGCVKVAVMSTT